MDYDLSNFSDEAPKVVENKKSLRPAFLFFILLTVFCFLAAVYGSTGEKVTFEQAADGGLEKGTIVSGEPAYGASTPNLTYTQSVVFFLNNNEYYFVVLPENGKKVILVRAPKDFGENFDSVSKENVKNVKISGKVRETDDAVANRFASSGIDAASTYYFVDMLSTDISLRWICIGIFNLVFIVYAAICAGRRKNGDQLRGVVTKLISAVMILGLFGCTYLIIKNITLM